MAGRLDMHQAIPRFASCISVATDCSGIESPLMALNLMGIKYKHVFSSEIDSKCIDFIKRNFKPEILYTDLTLRDNSVYSVKPIDLYIAGFPCQSFSSLGKKEGFKCSKIFFYVYDFIKTNRPNIFILENVKALITHDKGNTFRTILDSLSELAEYDISYTTLNTKDFGIPQSRTRLFIVGIKKGKSKCKFQFPEPQGNLNVKLEDILDSNLEGKISLNEKQTKLMNEISLKYPDIDFSSLAQSNSPTWILNLNVSSIKWFRRGQKDISPCLVTNCKYYIPSLKRYLTPREALKLQGIPWEKYDFNFSDSTIYRFAGNTISVNVIFAILIKCLELLDVD